MDTIKWAEEGKVPDALIRGGIRRLLARRLAEERAAGKDESIDAFVADLDASPLAVATDAANEQHYEVPSGYFVKVLGRRLKYSCTWWGEGLDDLDASEEAMLALTAERADLKDGMRVLELGCGWGSFTLWAAERFPGSEIVAVSNSRTQRAFIEARAKERGLGNVRVVTADMNTFAPPETFDRVVSIEMFEHMKNYRRLMERIASWLNPGGKLFVHIFVHRTYAYPFEDRGDAGDWMARYFFTGGNMPSDDLLLRFQDHLAVESHWRVNGKHYSKTLEAWLRRQDAAEGEILPLFAETYGGREAAKRWLRRWRIFYMACSELFRYGDGWEWFVAHYRFTKRA